VDRGGEENSRRWPVGAGSGILWAVIVFFAVGVVILLVLWMVATFAMKRRRGILEANRERLEELRHRPDWPQRLDAFAQQAAARGRLIEADGWAAGVALADANPQATYYARLDQALVRALGSLKKFDPFGDDD
jgi:hypothetical protein